MNMFKIFLDSILNMFYVVVERVQNTRIREETMPEQANSTIVSTYLVYLLISVTLTVWVARTLYKRGAIFLVDAFQGNAQLAASVNHLLVVGFYLINIGFVSLALKTQATIFTSRAAIELLSDKLGMVLLTLGGMHFFNLYVFSRIRKSGLNSRRVPPPPVVPNAMLNVAAPR